MIGLRIGGQLVQQIGPFGELTWSHDADGGCKAASWNMDLPPRFTSRRLARGQLVEVLDGPARVWVGVVDEVEPGDDWSFTAKGLAELAYGDGAYLCFDGAGNTTSVPDVAIDQAIGRGLPWRRAASFSGAAVTADVETDGLVKLGDLLDAYCESVGHRWGVGADGVVRHGPDATSPTWLVTADAGRMGLAEDDYASDVFVRYLNISGQPRTVTASDPVARAKFGRREGAADRTALGAITDAQASSIAQGIVTLGSARLAWTNGIEVARSQITNTGGVTAYLPLVEAGQMIRQFGVIDEQGAALPYLDWVIGETAYEAGSDVISLSPLGLAERTLGDILSGEAA